MVAPGGVALDPDEQVGDATAGVQSLFAQASIRVTVLSRAVRQLQQTHVLVLALSFGPLKMAQMYLLNEWLPGQDLWCVTDGTANSL